MHVMLRLLYAMLPRLYVLLRACMYVQLVTLPVHCDPVHALPVPVSIEHVCIVLYYAREAAF